METILKELLRLRKWKTGLKVLGVFNDSDHWTCRNTKKHYEIQKESLWAEAEEETK